MDGFNAILEYTWIGPLIGAIGIIISITINRSSRVGARLVYQSNSLRLIGKEEQALPAEVQINYKGKSVPRLTITNIIFWNSGKATIDGTNIVKDDPIKFEFSSDTQVLNARVNKATRESNKLKILTEPSSSNVVLCDFDYLDPGDGVVLEILHTDKNRYPIVSGTIKGIPSGIVDWGTFWSANIISRVLPFKLKSNVFLRICILVGAIMFFAGLVAFKKNNNIFNTTQINDGIILIIGGLLYTLLPVFFIWFTRRRFPKSLLVEDLEDLGYKDKG